MHNKIAIGGFLFSLLNLWIKARAPRRGWHVIKAICVDRELRGAYTAKGRGKTWAFRLICEFDVNEKHYKVTPAYWKTFSSEAFLKRFLNRRIASDGACLLHVNLENPLQTEFVGKDLKDLLLH